LLRDSKVSQIPRFKQQASLFSEAINLAKRFEIWESNLTEEDEVRIMEVVDQVV
jgi:hypothetical protein